jgi:hypothetical protein
MESSEYNQAFTYLWATVKEKKAEDKETTCFFLSFRFQFPCEVRGATFFHLPNIHNFILSLISFLVHAQ